MTARGDRSPVWILLAIWLGVAAFDVAKAVHADDTAHLEIARAILSNPLHSMSGLVNWDQTAAPIHRLNQPHLLFYLMAPVMAWAPGHTELALHLVWVLFSGAAVALFYGLARALATPRPLLWTAAFALGPALLPGQNLMVDVPLLALWLGFFLAIARAERHAAVRRLVVAGLLLAAACLVKYTSLALLPIFALAIVRRAGGRALWLLLVPLGALAAWSIFNWFDYGGVHILARPISTSQGPSALRSLGVIVGRMGLWLIALGAVSPFSAVFVGALARERPGRLLLGFVAFGAAVTLAIGRVALGSEPVVQSALRALFLANGLLVGALTGRAFRAERQPTARWLLGAWVIGAFLFVVGLSPFIAVRHVMLAIPALLLLLARGADAARLSRRALAAALGLSMLCGGALAASDAALAEVYRAQAPALAARYCANVRCVAVGHWGWQWYAERAGMLIYDTERTTLAAGDRLIVPELISKQSVRPDQAARLKLIAEVEVPSTALTWVRTIATEHSGAQGDRSGGYYYFWTSVPWTLTTRPLDRFRIYEVVSPDGAPPEHVR